MKKIIFGLFLVLAMAGSVLAQSPIARFIFEDAEEAFAKQDYRTTLVKLKEAEKEFGDINAPILYLRIMARNEILKASTSLDFDNLAALREDCDKYLKDYGENEHVRDKAREVYKLSTALVKYPASKGAYLREEAEAAFARHDYRTTLAKLKEAEKELGKIDPAILYLGIRTRNEILKASSSLDFDNLTGLREDCNKYLKEYGSLERVRDQALVVNNISATLVKYPASKEAYLREEAAKRQAEEAKRKEEEARLETVRLQEALSRLKENMLPVKGGCFQMGDTSGGVFTAPEGGKDERPVHEVCVNDFYIGKYEVTQKEWVSVMGNNPSNFKICDDCPVEKVSWNDVQDYISRLNSRTGKNYRLPTEAEWEYAARSGGKKEKYSGGDDIDAVAWYSSNSGKQTHPVGQKRPNGLGIYDMSGNVWEWTGDWYGNNYYESSHRDNPTGPSSGEYKVYRGGSWYNIPAYVRASYRTWYEPAKRYDIIGFRLSVPAQ